MHEAHDARAASAAKPRGVRGQGPGVRVDKRAGRRQKARGWGARWNGREQREAYRLLGSVGLWSGWGCIWGPDRVGAEVARRGCWDANLSMLKAKGKAVTDYF